MYLLILLNRILGSYLGLFYEHYNISNDKLGDVNAIHIKSVSFLYEISPNKVDCSHCRPPEWHNNRWNWPLSDAVFLQNDFFSINY